MALETDTSDEDLKGGLALGSAVPEEEEETGALPYAGVRKAMEARKKAATARQAYYDDLTAKLTARQAGPSFSERMFQLSSALFAPTSVRGFSGVMGNVLPVLQKQEQAQREGEIKRQDALNALTAAQLGQQEELLGQELDTEIELAKLTTPKPAKMVGTQIVDGVPVAIMQDASGAITTKPLGTAGATGSPTNIGEVSKRGGVMGFINERGAWTPLPQRTEKETFRPASAEEAAMYGATTGQISSTGRFIPGVAPKERQLSPREQTLLVKTEDVALSAEDTVRKLQRAIELNPQALEGSLTGFRKQVGSLFSSDDPAYVATEELDNTLSQIALGMLKETFPGAISNDERKALVALQGSSDKPRPVRDRIYRNALAAAQRVSARAAARTQKIQEGFYTQKGPAAKTIRYDRTGKRIG